MPPEKASKFRLRDGEEEIFRCSSLSLSKVGCRKELFLFFLFSFPHIDGKSVPLKNTETIEREGEDVRSRDCVCHYPTNAQSKKLRFHCWATTNSYSLIFGTMICIWKTHCILTVFNTLQINKTIYNVYLGFKILINSQWNW